MLIRLCLLILAAAPGLSAARDAAGYFRLIAHRGGVVEEQFPDNSAAALEAAVARGYRGLEVDIRESKDGVLVMQHDPDFKRNFGDARRAQDLTWDEMRALRSRVADQPVLRFEDVVKKAREAGLWLMLDSKNPHGPGFCDKLEAILRRHDMLERCLVIGSSDALQHFVGKAPVGLKARALKPKLEADPALARHYFLFDEGGMTEETVRWAQARGLRIVPSINVYHYYDAETMAGKSREELAPVIFAAARRDVEKLKALGVTEFQIDSEFDGWFESPQP